MCTPSPAPTRTPSPGNSLPGGWLGQDGPQGACLYLPRFASLLARWAALALSSQWGKEGRPGWSGGDRDRDGMGAKGLGAEVHAPGGQEGVTLPGEGRSCPCLLLSHRAWAAGGLGRGTVGAAQEGCHPSAGRLRAQAVPALTAAWSPAPPRPLAPPLHTQAAVAPTHNLGFYCADRGTLREDRFFCCCFS